MARSGEQASSNNPVMYQKSDYRTGVLSSYRKSHKHFEKLSTVTGAPPQASSTPSIAPGPQSPETGKISIHKMELLLPSISTSS